MKPREKYNLIIEMIEDCVRHQDKVDADLIYHLARKNLMEVRDLIALFKFMLNETVKQYIVKRKLMASYKFIVESEKLDTRTAVDISGYDNHSSFDKRFGAMFGMSPSEAHKQKNLDLFIPPQTWDQISLDACCNIADKAGEITLVKNKFNITLATYEKVLKIEELRAIYGLPELLEDFVQELVEDMKLSYEEAFRYAGALHDFCGDFNCDEEPESFSEVLSPVDELREIAYDAYNRFIFFDCGLSISAGCDLQDRSGLTEERLMAESPKILVEYVHWTRDDYVNYNYFKNACLYFQENATEEYSEESFDRYISDVCAGIPKEIVFEHLIPNYDDCSAYIVDDSDWEMDEFEVAEMDTKREKWLFKK